MNTDAIIKTKSNNLSIIPAYLNLAGVDMELIELEKQYKDTDKKFNRVMRLKDELAKIRDNYDYIIFAYNDKTNTVRYIYCDSLENGADQPYYLELEW